MLSLFNISCQGRKNGEWEKFKFLNNWHKNKTIKIYTLKICYKCL